MLNEKQVSVLTEEEIRGIDIYNDGNNYEATVINKLVASHRTLNSRNAKLVHENDELMAENVKYAKFLKDLQSNFYIVGDYNGLDKVNRFLEGLKHE